MGLWQIRPPTYVRYIGDVARACGSLSEALSLVCWHGLAVESYCLYVPFAYIGRANSNSRSDRTVLVELTDLSHAGRVDSRRYFLIR